jgi:beta-xylosidase
VAQVNGGMLALVNSDPNVKYVTTHDITSGFADNAVHYTADQTVTIGQRWAAAYVAPPASHTNAYLTSLALNPPGLAGLTSAFATGTFVYGATNAYVNSPTVTVTNADLTATNQLIFNGATNLLTVGRGEFAADPCRWGDQRGVGAGDGPGRRDEADLHGERDGIAEPDHAQPDEQSEQRDADLELARRTIWATGCCSRPQQPESLNYTQMNAYGLGIWAGSIRYYSGKFWVYYSTGGYGYFMSSATNAAGPWAPLTRVTYDNNANSPGPNWDDCCSFQDDDGKLYFIGTDWGSGWITHLCQMNTNGTQLLSATDTIIYNGSYGEANKLYKINGSYYIYHSLALTFTSLRNPYMLRATNIWGNGGSPGHAGTYTEQQLYNSTGYGDQFENGGLIQAGSGSWYFMMAQANFVQGRPPCLLPVTWTANWPVIGAVTNGGLIGSMVWSGTKPTNGFPIVLPQGNDEFTSPYLDPHWEWNYQPNAAYWSLSDRPGYLRLYAYQPLTSGSFFTAGNTIGDRYIRGDWAQADLKIDLSNMASGEEAGMAHYNDGFSYCTIGVVQNGGTKTLKFNANGTIIIGPVVTNSTIYFRTILDITATAKFFYGYDGINFTQLGGNYPLTLGKYRGDRIGIYNYNNNSATGYIDVDWFHYAYAGPVLPLFASSPVPASGSVNVSTAPNLNWQAGNGATAHQVYFGTNPILSGPNYQGQQTSTNFTLPALAPNTTYYWRVDEVNSNGVQAGNVWSFTTWWTPPQSISITNHSFESQIVSSGSFLPGDPTSWHSSLLAGTVDAVVNPGPLGSGEPWPADPPSGLDATNVCQIYAISAGGGGLVYQDTGVKYQPGTVYQLTAVAGLQINQTFNAGSLIGFYNSSLTCIASNVINSATLFYGTFTGQSVSYTTTGAEGGNGDIIVGFYAPPAAAAGSYFDFDNVQLTQYNQGPLLNSPPGSQTTSIGGTATFSVGATGTAPLSYQWQANGGTGFTNLINGGQVSGATSNILGIASVTTNWALAYQVIVTNGYWNCHQQSSGDADGGDG